MAVVPEGVRDSAVRAAEMALSRLVAIAAASVEKSYSFNEDVCAATSACLVKKMLEIGE